MSPFVVAMLAAAAGPVTVTWAGHLETAAGVVDGEVSAAFVVTDEATGEVLLDAFEPTFAVVGGDFTLDVPVPDGGAALLTLVVNGETFAPLRVEAMAPVVAFAEGADAADVAFDAAALDGIVDPVLLAELAPGAGPGVDVAFENVTGAPVDFDDGDDGLVLVPDASFSFVDGALTLLPRGVSTAQLGALSGADLADNSVNATHVQPATLTATDVTGTLPLTKLAADTIGLLSFSTAATAVEVFEVNVDRCDAPRGTLQVDRNCTFTGSQDCSITIGGSTFPGYTDCTGFCSSTGPTSSCPLPSVGYVVFP